MGVRVGEAGMDAHGQPLGPGNAGEQIGERRPVRRAETGGELLLVLGRKGGEPLEQGLTGRRDVERMGPPVIAALAALDPAALLEPVNESDNPARRKADRLGHLALRATFGERNEPEQHDLARLEPECGDPLGPALRRLAAELREEERDPGPLHPDSSHRAETVAGGRRGPSSATAGITSRPMISIGRIRSTPTTQPITVSIPIPTSHSSFSITSPTFSPRSPTSNPNGAVFSIRS